MTAELENWIAVCSLEHLAERGTVCARAGGIDLIVVRDGDRIHACERACPHEQADLSLGRVTDGKLFCPRHRAWFSLQNGDMSPGWPSPALRRYPVRMSGGQIWIRLTPTTPDAGFRPERPVSPVPEAESSLSEQNLFDNQKS